MQMFQIFKRFNAASLFKWTLGFVYQMSFNLDKILKTEAMHVSNSKINSFV